MDCKIVVEPHTSLFVDDVKIQGYSFLPHSKITIQCTYISAEERLHLQSFAHLQCDGNGHFDLSTTESVGGTYTGIQPMGLFWSMESSGKSLLLRRVDITRPLDYKVVVYDGFQSDFIAENQLCEYKFKKLNMSSSIERIPVKKDNLRGTIFIPKGEGPFPGVVLIYGGVQKHHVFEETAAHLANNGIAAFILAFYGVEGLPRRYTDSPIKLEYFEEAIDFFLSHNYIMKQGVGLFGQSKGAEISIALMSVLPKVISVAVAPITVFGLVTPITYKGKQLANLHVSMDDLTNHLLPQVSHNTNTVSLGGYSFGIPPQDCIFPFYLTPTNLFIIIAGDDHNSDTQHFTDIAINQMKKVGKTNYEIVSYDGLGHLVYLPNTPVANRAGHPSLPSGVFMAYGGENKLQHYLAEKDLWPKMIEFFKRTICNTPIISNL